ncbi:hypothetical protein TraAM80_08922 [Trypanosoma rangeli]|uniref:Uncharacterized protein n=1 Tax=Trypanosoma rangeli TaxID=5698 RepID=A0A422MY89_TRYRA|nr:uncharacterized protein TraAM80_08922 [Trypanosoma rangeli]RNE98214.1 hypothetical protein TraAM80_08922 [Trypanosoma rangeli]|eukprot:RNE98214.1 hypothetical protein TraAM80_08922 [Trypanosoma rangeli]
MPSRPQLLLSVKRRTRCNFGTGRCVTACWRRRMEAYVPCVVIEVVSCFPLRLFEVLHFHEHRGAAGRRAIAAGLLVAVVSLREFVFVTAEGRHLLRVSWWWCVRCLFCIVFIVLSISFLTLRPTPSAVR